MLSDEALGKKKASPIEKPFNVEAESGSDDDMVED